MPANYDSIVDPCNSIDDSIVIVFNMSGKNTWFLNKNRNSTDHDSIDDLIVAGSMEIRNNKK